MHSRRLVYEAVEEIGERTVNYLHLLAKMADIQKEMQEIQSEDGFVSINPREIQVKPHMFKALFPNEDSIFDEVTGGYHYSAEIAGVKVTAYMEAAQ